MATKLTELEISEVSLVDRGAIGEVFTVIKAEEVNDNIVNEYNSEQIVQQIAKLSDEEFISIMKNLMSRYEEINKGGNSMNDEVKKFVEDLFAESMQTINKNFSSINKAIDDIQQTVQKVQQSSEEIQKAAKTKEEEEKEAQEKAKKEEEERICRLSKSVEELTKTVTSISESLKSVQESLEKVNTEKADLEKRLGNLEAQPNSSNQPKDDVNKSADPKKVPFWKSIIGTPEE